MLRLREVRKKAHLTMKELGKVIGVAESTISQYETGKRQPDYETLLKLGEFFGVSTDYLLGICDSPVSARDTLLKMVDETDDLDELLAILDLVNKKLQERK